MNINLAYGKGYLPVELPGDRTTVIEPTHTPGLPDEQVAVIDAVPRTPATNQVQRRLIIERLTGG